MHKHSYTAFVGKYVPGSNNNSTLSGMKMSSSIMNSNLNSSKKINDNKSINKKQDNKDD